MVDGSFETLVAVMHRRHSVILEVSGIIGASGGYASLRRRILIRKV